MSGAGSALPRAAKQSLISKRVRRPDREKQADRTSGLPVSGSQIAVSKDDAVGTARIYLCLKEIVVVVIQLESRGFISSCLSYYQQIFAVHSAEVPKSVQLALKAAMSSGITAMRLPAMEPAAMPPGTARSRADL